MKLIKLDLLDGLAKPYISVRAEDFERIARYLRDANNAIEQQPASKPAVQVPDTDAFYKWWYASKYMQVVYSGDGTMQAALDGWSACVRAISAAPAKVEA